MKLDQNRFTKTAQTLAFCLVLSSPAALAQSQDPAGSGATDSDVRTTGTSTDRMAGSDAQSDYNKPDKMKHKKDKRADDIVGKQVRADNEEVGSISDFVIDSESGKITHAVIRSGGVLGIGGDAKAVSFDSLQPAEGDQEGMTIARSDWDSAQDFDENRLSALDEGQSSSAAMTTDNQAQPQGSSDRLVLASNLEDLEIQGQQGEIGEVEGVIVHADRGEASLLVELEDSVGSDDQPYVVSFSRVTLQGSQGDRSLQTELTASDFQTASTSGSTGMDSDQPYVWNQEEQTTAAE